MAMFVSGSSTSTGSFARLKIGGGLLGSGEKISIQGDISLSGASNYEVVSIRNNHGSTANQTRQTGSPKAH